MTQPYLYPTSPCPPTGARTPRTPASALTSTLPTRVFLFANEALVLVLVLVHHLLLLPYDLCSDLLLKLFYSLCSLCLDPAQEETICKACGVGL